MHLKILLFTVQSCVLVSSQQSESASRCQGTPTVNCNCGASSQDQNTGDQFSNIRQGRPGRIGPIGSAGPKGQKV